MFVYLYERVYTFPIAMKVEAMSLWSLNDIVPILFFCNFFLSPFYYVLLILIIIYDYYYYCVGIIIAIICQVLLQALRACVH